MRMLKGFLFALALVSLLLAQERNGSIEQATVQVRHAGDVGPAMTFGEVAHDYAHGLFGHPYHVSAKHPRTGCLQTAVCGEEFYHYDGWNLRTSIGTTWQAELMSKTTTPTANLQCNYIGLTNTAIVPAEADTALSGIISSNGLGIAQATYTNNSTNLAVPSAPTVALTGGGGGTAQFYFIEACNQGVCTTPSAASVTATPGATLSATVYDTVSWTPVPGAATYVVIRSNSGSAPSGSEAGGATQSSTGQVSTGIPGCTAATCTIVDSSNTLNAYIIPGSNATNFGTYTLVHTWTATGSQSAQGFGVFWTSGPTASTMCFEGTFTQVSLNTNDTFQLTETVNF